MNKTEFMNVLSDKLHGLPKDDYEDAINYYTEFFMDGDIDDETDVIPIVVLLIVIIVRAKITCQGQYC